MLIRIQCKLIVVTLKVLTDSCEELLLDENKLLSDISYVRSNRRKIYCLTILNKFLCQFQSVAFVCNKSPETTMKKEMQSNRY